MKYYVNKILQVLLLLSGMIAIYYWFFGNNKALGVFCGLLSVAFGMIGSMFMGSDSKEPRSVKKLNLQEDELGGIQEVGDYMEFVASSANKFHILFQSDRKAIYVTVPYSRSVYKGFSIVIKEMQAEKVKIFLTNEPSGKRVKYRELKETLLEAGLVEHILVMDTLLEEEDKAS